MLTRATSYKLQATSLFFVDQILKYLARTFPDFFWYIWKPWLGWEYFENSGIAFGIHLPQWAILLATPFVICALLFTLLRATTLQSSVAIVFILLGAASNFIDRLFFGFTIDYLRIATGVFNLADFLIGGGIFFLLFHPAPRIPRA